MSECSRKNKNKVHSRGGHARGTRSGPRFLPLPFSFQVRLRIERGRHSFRSGHVWSLFRFTFSFTLASDTKTKNNATTTKATMGCNGPIPTEAATSQEEGPLLQECSTRRKDRSRMGCRRCHRLHPGIGHDGLAHGAGFHRIWRSKYQNI